ncbi:phosphopyruvate hydratase [Methanolapillus ohkumae]|uniref:Enolase n=1 Tax=Methanolapillus ohkumae TaxID=3028298 RepID=A0AA96ZVW6_9EURY|nr:Enolase [Methanosarcinaceae archaeon Am2]
MKYSGNSSDRFAIRKIIAREILDSRGNPTVEVDIFTDKGFGRAAVPSGASTGTHEALEMRDGDKSRFMGKGVLKAVENVGKISSTLIGMDVRKQREIDMLMLEMDGTDNKSNLGANAILGVSMAVAKAAADSLNVPLYRYLGGSNSFSLPVPTLNVLNGGKHAGNDLAIQEFMIQPVGAETFKEAIQMGAETYHALGKYLQESYGASSANVGFEGGYAPKMEKTTEAMDALMIAIDRAGYSEEDIKIGLDAAASEFFDGENYKLDGEVMTPEELTAFYIELVNNYPILSIEDPFHEESFEDFENLTGELWETIIVGDDLFVTNPERIAKGIECGAANGLLLKVNQIGTLSEAIDAATLATRNGFSLFVSHRSAETEDTTIADLAVALGADMIKTGAPARGERTAKYNQLLRIEEELGDAAEYVRL